MTTYYDDSNSPQQKTIVRDDDLGNQDSLPGRVKIVDYAPKNPPNNMVGTFTPPTIVVSPSEKEGDDFFRPNSINLDLTNDLPVNVQLAGDLPQTKENLESVSQYTNIHYHGFNVSPLLGADDVLVDVPSNVTPKPIDVPSRSEDEIELNGTASSDDVKVTYNVFSDNRYKLIPVPPLGETTPDSSSGSEGDLPGGYYDGDDPAAPKYGGPTTEYKMDVKIPYVHQSGLFWYHSHAHSLSDNQVRAGLSGGIIIKGSDQYYEILSSEKGIKVATGTPSTPLKEPEKFSVNQKVMMFKDFNDVLAGGSADCFTLNGQVNPSITIKPGEVQLWRIANVGADQYMNIALEEADISKPAFARPNKKPNFYILARDADFVEQVVPTDSVLLPPASRVEVLVVGGNTVSGNKTYNLVSDLTTGLTEGEKWVGEEGGQLKSYLLATVEVDGEEPVCYEDKNQRKLGLTIGSISCTQDQEELYAYIEKQTPTTQTGRDGDPDVDKILPDPEILFDGYYEDNDYTIKECESRTEDFVNNSCLTPSTLYSDPLTKKRYFYFSQSFPKFFLKGFEKKQTASKTDLEIQELYDGNRIDKISRIGDLEEWHLVNVTPATHVFHIHQLDFVVTEVTLNQDPCKGIEAQKCTYNNYEVGTYKGETKDPEYKGCTKNDGDNTFTCPLLPQGYRDVINLPPSSTTTVRIPFVNPFITGPFVYHCHILFHEDRGMMNNLKVVNTKGYGGEEVIPQLQQISGR
ncbi:hypothetical protein D5R40_02805 [Okeania hirsuta]|uniref:Plastocyanin-like domain-containing protein n=1 Tax=Okeania hirsuta TaxID=1458930 RepID=A0A3N6RQU7_9CYAN|nr:multicopper oxidase domain-containing protein [Okeania hirsuta]RQH55373.1 hypothetical protein D5R40_02805 [Okeania hirsuta]